MWENYALFGILYAITNKIERLIFKNEHNILTKYEIRRYKYVLLMYLNSQMLILYIVTQIK